MAFLRKGAMTVGGGFVSGRWSAASGLWVVAAALMSCCAFCPVSDAVRLKYLETPIGGRASVKLADGSLVMLNTDSIVRMRVDGPATRMEILQGEVFFR